MAAVDPLATMGDVDDAALSQDLTQPQGDSRGGDDDDELEGRGAAQADAAGSAQVRPANDAEEEGRRGGNDAAAAVGDDEDGAGSAQPEGGTTGALTVEQQAIADLAKPPSAIMGTDGEIILVTSGAGTGKTTTLQAVSRRLIEQGHARPVYGTFSTSGARDAAKRLPGVRCGTLDALALSCVAESLGLGVSGEQGIGRFLSPHDFTALTKRLCAAEIGDAVAGVRQQRLRLSAADTMANYIRKTLEDWMQSDKGLDDLRADPQALVWHTQGKVPGVVRQVGDLYARCARRVWLRVQPGAVLQADEERVVTHASVMKHAQANDVQINTTALLIDESQDCNAAQLLWVAQHRKGRQLFLVGDAVQTIYTFRGAKPSLLLALPDVIKKQLTRCFRFGPEFAAIANLVLFAKQMSVQRLGWTPYRLTGAGCAGEVVTDCNDITPRTVLACQNVSLLKRGMEILQHHTAQGRAIKIGINGGAQGRGQQRWLESFALVRALYDVFIGNATTLPEEQFPEFADNTDLTWDSVCKAAREGELSRLSMPLSIVNKFKQDTLSIVADFEEQVLRVQHKPEDIEILLSTVHAAKGMEWDTVELLDDGTELAQFRALAPGPAAAGYKTAELQAGTNLVKCEFLVTASRDEVNLLYVGLTRARRTLCVPPSITNLLNAFENITKIKQACDAGSSTCTVCLGPDDAITLPVPADMDEPVFFWPPYVSKSTAASGYSVGRRKYPQLFSVGQVQRLYAELVAPWRAEAPPIAVRLPIDMSELVVLGDTDDRSHSPEGSNSEPSAKRAKAGGSGY